MINNSIIKVFLFVFLTSKLNSQQLELINKYHVYDSKDQMLRVDLSFKFKLTDDSYLDVDKSDIQKIKSEQPFNLLEFDFFYYERWLVMDNNDTVRFENEYDQITFNTVNTKKKHYPKNTLFVFKATIVNIYFLNQAIEDYNINNNSKYKGKCVILKIYDRQRKLPPISYYYYIKNND